MADLFGGLPGDVYFGGPGRPLPDWRREHSVSEEHSSHDDDEPTPVERRGVIGMLGFDPGEFDAEEPERERGGEGGRSLYGRTDFGFASMVRRVLYCKGDVACEPCAAKAEAEGVESAYDSIDMPMVPGDDEDTDPSPSPRRFKISRSSSGTIRVTYARSTPVVRNASGQTVSARSKSQSPACSQAASAWRTGSASKETYTVLAHCRAMAATKHAAKLHEAAGNSGKAAHLHKVATSPFVSKKSRNERAAALHAQRDARGGAVDSGAQVQPPGGNAPTPVPEAAPSPASTNPPAPIASPSTPKPGAAPVAPRPGIAERKNRVLNKLEATREASNKSGEGTKARSQAFRNAGRDVVAKGAANAVETGTPGYFSKLKARREAAASPGTASPAPAPKPQASPAPTPAHPPLPTPTPPSLKDQIASRRAARGETPEDRQSTAERRKLDREMMNRSRINTHGRAVPGREHLATGARPGDYVHVGSTTTGGHRDMQGKVVARSGDRVDIQRPDGKVFRGIPASQARAMDAKKAKFTPERLGKANELRGRRKANAPTAKAAQESTPAAEPSPTAPRPSLKDASAAQRARVQAGKNVEGATGAKEPPAIKTSPSPARAAAMAKQSQASDADSGTATSSPSSSAMPDEVKDHVRQALGSYRNRAEQVRRGAEVANNPSIGGGRRYVDDTRRNVGAPPKAYLKDFLSAAKENGIEGKAAVKEIAKEVLPRTKGDPLAGVRSVKPNAERARAVLDKVRGKGTTAPNAGSAASSPLPSHLASFRSQAVSHARDKASKLAERARRTNDPELKADAADLDRAASHAASLDDPGFWNTQANSGRSLDAVAHEVREHMRKAGQGPEVLRFTPPRAASQGQAAGDNTSSGGSTSPATLATLPRTSPVPGLPKQPHEMTNHELQHHYDGDKEFARAWDSRYAGSPVNPLYHRLYLQEAQHHGAKVPGHLLGGEGGATRASAPAAPAARLASLKDQVDAKRSTKGTRSDRLNVLQNRGAAQFNRRQSGGRINEATTIAMRRMKLRQQQEKLGEGEKGKGQAKPEPAFSLGRPRASSSEFSNSGSGKTLGFLDQKKGDLKGQASLMDKVGSVDTKEGVESKNPAPSPSSSLSSTHAAIKKGLGKIFGGEPIDDRGMTIQQIAKQSGVSEDEAATWTHEAAKKGIVEYDHLNDHDAEHAKQFSRVHADPKTGKPIAAVRIMRPKRLEEMAGEGGAKGQESPAPAPAPSRQTPAQERRALARNIPKVSGGSPMATFERAATDTAKRSKVAGQIKRLRVDAGRARTDPATHTNHAPGTITPLNTEHIHFDPDRFQYKLGHAANTGSVGSLQGVSKWNPELGGIMQVWKDPSNGKTYVVNGHNRLDLAKRLGANKVNVQFIHAPHAEAAKAKGALTNIAEGRGSSIDAANFFRSSGVAKEDLEKHGIPMKEKIATEGLALSKLPKPLFDRVVQGDLHPEKAAIIGGSGLSHEQQKAVAQQIDKASKSRPLTPGAIRDYIDDAKEAGSVKTQGHDLFGSNEEETSLALHRARASDAIRDRLSREKRLFGTVAKSKAAQDLARAGNTINTEESGKISRDAGNMLGVYDLLKRRSGAISPILNLAAERLHAGEHPKKVIDETYHHVLGEARKVLGQ